MRMLDVRQSTYANVSARCGAFWLCALTNMNRENLDEDICVHIFTTSAAMLGVCMTVVGVIRVVTAVRRVNTVADEMLSINAIVYLFAGLCAYCALRSKRGRRNRVLERVADGIFLVGLVMSAVATAYIAWVVSEF